MSNHQGARRKARLDHALSFKDIAEHYRGDFGSLFPCQRGSDAAASTSLMLLTHKNQGMQLYYCYYTRYLFITRGATLAYTGTGLHPKCAYSIHGVSGSPRPLRNCFSLQSKHPATERLWPRPTSAWAKWGRHHPCCWGLRNLDTCHPRTSLSLPRRGERRRWCRTRRGPPSWSSIAWCTRQDYRRNPAATRERKSRQNRGAAYTGVVHRCSAVYVFRRTYVLNSAIARASKPCRCSGHIGVHEESFDQQIDQARLVYREIWADSKQAKASERVCPAVWNKNMRGLTLHVSSSPPKALSGWPASSSVEIKLWRRLGRCAAQTSTVSIQEVPKQFPSGSMLMEYPENHLLMSRMAGLRLLKSSLIFSSFYRWIWQRDERGRTTRHRKEKKHEQNERLRSIWHAYMPK